jgi:hypothetical protein
MVLSEGSVPKCTLVSALREPSEYVIFVTFP